MDKNRPFSDELISAYLDGELSAEEQAQLEQTLAQSAAHRQMLEELKSLRSSLQSLPKLQLDEDFSQRVLRRAEREMLGRNQDDGVVALQTSVSTLTSVSSTRKTSWRLVTSITSLAAVVLLMVFLFIPEDGRDVAMPTASDEADDDREFYSVPTDRLAEREVIENEGRNDALVLDSIDSQPNISNRYYSRDYESNAEKPSTFAYQEHPGVIRQEAGPFTSPESSAAESLAFKSVSFVANPGDQLLVWVDVPRSRKELQEIDGTLLRNNVQVVSEADESKRALGLKGIEFEESAESQDNWFSKQLAQKKFSAQADYFDLIEVEASAVQVNSLLTSLQTQPEAFSNISIETVPDKNSAKANGELFAGKSPKVETLEAATASTEKTPDLKLAEKDKNRPDEKKQALSSSATRQRSGGANLEIKTKKTPASDESKSEESLKKNDAQAINKPIEENLNGNLSTLNENIASSSTEERSSAGRKNNASGLRGGAAPSSASYGRAYRLRRKKPETTKESLEKRLRLWQKEQQENSSNQLARKNNPQKQVQLLIILRAVDSPHNEPAQKESSKAEVKQPEKSEK